MKVISHHTAAQLQKARRKALGGLRDRIQMVILAMAGHTAPSIAEAVGFSRRTVQHLVSRHNRGGLSGLQDRRGGNHRLLTVEQQRLVCEHIDRAAADPHAGIRGGEDLRQWIHQQFGVLYTLTGVYELLRRLGYSCLMPRPRHVQSDPAVQAEFKKKPAARWHRSPGPARTSRSRSGSRMKHGSGSREP